MQCDQLKQLMPPPRLTRPLRPCHPPWGPLQVRCASRQPRDTAASPHGDHTPTSPARSKPTLLGVYDSGASSPPNSTSHPDAPRAQSEETRSEWWGSMVGSISKLLSGSATSMSDAHPYSSSTQDAPNPPSQPQATDEAPSLTAKPGKVRPREVTIEEQRAMSDVRDAVKTDQGTVLAVTAQETSSWKGPALLDGNNYFRKHYAHITGERLLQPGQERSTVDAKPGHTAGHKPNTIIPPSRDLDVRQQLQQLVEQVRQLQAILDPPSPKTQDLSKISLDTVHQKMDPSSSPSHDKPKVVPRSSGKIYSPSLDSRNESMILPRKGQVRSDSRNGPGSKTFLSGAISEAQPTTPRSRSPPKTKTGRQRVLTSSGFNKEWARYSSRYHFLWENFAKELGYMSSPQIAPLIARVNMVRRYNDDVGKRIRSQRRKAWKASVKDKIRSDRKKGPEKKYDSDCDQILQEDHRYSSQVNLGLRSSKDISSPTTTFDELPPLQNLSADIVRPRKYQPLTEMQCSKTCDPEHQAQRNEVDSIISSSRERIVSSIPEIMPESSKIPQNRPRPVNSHEQVAEVRNDTQRLTRQIHTHSQTLASSKLSTDAASNETSEQSLLEELFPGDSSYIQPHYTGRNPYPKLDLPSGNVPLIRREVTDTKKTLRERIIESFQNSGEQITALQFLNCSTELTDSDFRRLVPKGKHIESWAVKGQFYKIVPGRDPLSLDRLPFYYLLFESPESALAYQANVGRLHKLCTLRQASNIMSVMPVPQGLLEDGEDISAAMTSYLLKPSTLLLNLNMVMQPYNPALRSLLEEGGYRPIVPSVTASGKPLFKVLLKINGWEPTELDLYRILYRHAHHRGISWPFHTESHLAIHKLRDLIDLKARMQMVSAASPRASEHADGIGPALSSSLGAKPDPDPSMEFLLPNPENAQGNIHQMVMNRVYNRWIVEFDDEDGAKRFARLWNRRVLPQPKFVTWRDTEEERMVSAEFLW